MTKLIIQIPCYNEEGTLAATLAALPRSLPGVDVIERLVIDDGSTDGTLGVARDNGVEHIVRLPHNQGLARAFMAGLEGCLRAGADIIVNTDADNQYCADDIGKLIGPILAHEAEIVVGARPIDRIGHFSWIKKRLQKIGSRVVRMVSGTDIPDAPSGFRAISREAAIQLNVFNTHTYTLETIIQAGQHGIPIAWVPVRVNEELRPSRLIRSVPGYVAESVAVILRIFMLYRPLRFFMILGSIPFGIGLVLGFRWLALIYLFPEPGRTYLPSLILAAILLIMGFQTWLFGLAAELIAANRKLLEEIRVRQRRNELQAQGDTGKDSGKDSGDA